MDTIDSRPTSPSNSPSFPPSPSRIQNARTYYEQHEHQFAIALFIGGFIFDTFMVERPDAWAMIAQQAMYLSIILICLVQLFFEEARPAITQEQIDKMFLPKRWYYSYRTGFMHFFFGTLLNMYMIFFFKSSSLLVSFAFLFLLVFLLIANESHRFKSMGLSFKFALLGVCFLSFFSCLVPIAVGHMGVLVFLLSLVIGSLPLVLIGWWVQVRRPPLFERAKHQILLPMGFVLIAFLSLYVLKLTPPVPLSIPFMGVYHGVEREGEHYRLANERPWWKFWQHGDQNFSAQKTDRIFVAFRIFSPTHFSDQVLMRWYWKDNQRGWMLQDTIPIKIIGGREEGFRGYGTKTNYQPGEWRVQVETTDNREIGRIYFDLELSPEEPRAFEYDLM